MGGFFLFVFLVLPIAEILVAYAIAGAIGSSATVFLLLGGCIVGGIIVRRAGIRAWLQLQRAVVAGRPPRDVVDNAIVLLAGVLLLVPGFITDAVGIFLLIPQTRRLSRWLVAGYVGRRIKAARVLARRRGRPSPYGDVIEGEVVDAGSPDPWTKKDRPDQIGRAG